MLAGWGRGGVGVGGGWGGGWGGRAAVGRGADIVCVAGWGGAGRVMATTSEGPGAGTVMAPPLPHARKAPDGHYYIPDPTRPGKHIKLTQREQ